MRVPAVVIGAGHAGLAMSRRLTERSIDHIVIERGEVANSWRTERWDSLRLLTPNWHATLPGGAGTLAPPDGFMTAAEVAGMIGEYAATIEAPVIAHAPVERVTATSGGFTVTTARGTWAAATVVLATGPSALPIVPELAEALAPAVTQLAAGEYRNPAQLPEGGVLVVGGSATGVQLADEIHASGRPVTLSIGEHVRMPRRYRGRDIFWWLEVAGVLAERYDEVDDVVRARHVPSPQLIGDPSRDSIDVTTLHAAGVRIVGRLGRLDGTTAKFSGGLANTCALADLKLARLLRRFDAAALSTGVDADVGPPEPYEPAALPASNITELDLAADGIRTVVWATGWRPDHRFVELPVFDHRGRLRQDGGVTGVAGLYALGLPLLRRRRSTYIGGAAADTSELAQHLHRHLDTRVRSTAAG